MMGRQRKGAIAEKNGKLYARVRFVDGNRKNRDIWKRAENRKQAQEIIKQLLRELDDFGDKTLDAANMTVNGLCDYFQEHYLTPAEYIGERKISGVRSIIPVLAALKPIREHFGKKTLRSISYSEIRSYRAIRLKTPTRFGTQRSIATVNRELAKFHRILNIAQREGSILRNPFANGESLISAADEVHRERILTFEEEARLFAAIESVPKRKHLSGIFKIALDCALRRGEIFTLRWSDINFELRTITVRAFNAKTARSRIVVMTSRVYEELEKRWLSSAQNLDELVFGVSVTIKTSVGKICRDARIIDFHFHDCRHTAITRMIRAGLPPVEVMRVSGHSTMSAFYRYANSDMETAKRAAEALDAFYQRSEIQEAVTMIN
jgi:integrase